MAVKNRILAIKNRTLRLHLPHISKNNTKKLVAAFGKTTAFGRSDMIAVLGITPSPASALIKKLLEAGKIEAVTGHGKGKYIVK